MKQASKVLAINWQSLIRTLILSIIRKVIDFHPKTTMKCFVYQIHLFWFIFSQYLIVCSCIATNENRTKQITLTTIILIVVKFFISSFMIGHIV